MDLDTGAVVMDTDLLNALFGLMSSNNHIDDKKFDEFVNERARIRLLWGFSISTSYEIHIGRLPEGSSSRNF